MTIDPGTQLTGVALWGHWNAELAPDGVFLVSGGREPGWEQRTYETGKKLNDMIVNYEPQVVAIEQPEYYGHDAATASGAIIKLAVAVGMYAAIAQFRQERQVMLIPVSSWKGQMSKAIVERRIRKIIGASACRKFTKDIWDAVGIGIHLLRGGV